MRLRGEGRTSHPAAKALLLAAVLLLAGPWVLLAGETPEVRYRNAAATYHQLRERGNAPAEAWRELAGTFLAIHRSAPQGSRGADALYSAALAHRQAWRGGGDWRDLSKAAGTFREFTARYPRNRLADDSLMQLATLLAQGYSDRKGVQHTYRQLLAEYPEGDQAPAARRSLRELNAQMADRAPSSKPVVASGNREAQGGKDGKSVAGKAAAPRPVVRNTRVVGTLKKVQYWTSLEWTRVVLTTDRQAEYRFDQLGADGSNPERLYLDLTGIIPDDALESVTSVEDGVLHRIRIGRRGQSAARVVLDLAKVERTEVQDFLLPGERKIIVDLYRPQEQVRILVADGAKSGGAKGALDDHALNLPGTKMAPMPPTAVITPAANPVAKAAPQPATPAQGNPTEGKPAAPRDGLSLYAPLGLKVGTVVLDPGHGGHDPGAVAFGMREKDVALDIAHRLRRIMTQHRPDLKVGMTREDDRFISLNDRPRLAKEFGADLFVSIHLNANTIERFHGIETYFLNLTSDQSALKVAARENATSDKRVSDLNLILADLLRDTNMVESSFLAQAMQSSLVETLRGTTSQVRDLGVKQAPFLVLMGAEMPSVLVEAGFVTNRVENRRLQDSAYLERIAKGFYDGLREYIEHKDLLASRHGATVARNP